MSKISTYEVAPVPKLSDKLIGTSVGGEIEDITYNFTLLELLELFLPVIPANNLQGVLDYGNTATQDINLFGTITTTNLEVTDTANLFITYLNEETHIVGSLFDSADSIGTAGQVLTSTGDGVEWFTLPPIFTPNLQQVLEEGNTADLDIILDADLEAINITADTANIATQLSIQGTVVDYNESAGTSGQVLESTSTGVQWVNLPVYSATSPLLFDSSTNTFSIQVANSTQGGYLTANDWVTFDGKQNAGAYITALTGEATATGPGSVPITLNNASVIAKVLTGLNITGGSISATDSILTAFGKVQNQINGLMGGVQYQGVWDAATNTPTLTSSVGTQGHYYIVNVAGTTNLNGITDWQVGDWSIFSGGAWQKVDNTDSVTSVNGQTGAVSLTTDNIPEGTTNLYFLDSRARAAVSATSPLSYNNTTGVFSIQQASGTQNGYLSSTDWTTFNNKQNYLSGTGLVKSTAGTITYITDNSSNWNTAYNRSIISAAVTGTGTKTLTLNEQDGNTITASWSDADTGLTSVGLTMPSAFSVANSPLTSNGTIGVTGAGTTAEYIRGDGSLATFPSIISEAQNLVTEVYNSSGATLTKGTVVYINGGQGNLPTITKAIATGDPTSAQTYGVVRSDITNMNNGYVVVTGRLADLDTRDYTPGQQLYLSSTTAGAWTPTKQYAPAHLVYVGIVVRAHPTQGVVEILIQNGFEMDELHNVAAQNPDNNDILQFKTSTNLWTKVAGTTTNIAEGTNLYYLDSRARAALSFTPGSGAYNSTTGVITIPTNTNQLTNGAAFITLGSLSALAPLSYNNTTGAFSISQAGASTDGYLSSTDWNTFNNKQPAGSYVPTSRLLSINGTQYDLSADRSWSVGTVTSVAALTLGTSGTDLSSSVANGTTNPVITLNVPTASAANRGALSAADWSTFNTKVGGVTASSPLASSGGQTPNITIQQASGSQDGYLSSTDWTTFNNKQAAGNYITSLTGEATASGPGAASVTLNNASVTAKVLTGVNITGGSISATDSILTAFGKVQNQINGLVGGSIYQGTWNASTNTPALASGVGTKGYYYIVSVAGTTNLDGITDWFVGDWAIFDGTAWQQVDNTDAVVSVNGQTGAVSLTTDNIPEGSTNQYFLNSRARAALSFTAGSGAYNSTTGVITIPTNTSQLTNGANFITLASLSGTAPIVYSNTTGAISITQAGTASNGYLSSTDWNTFNNKQSALTNPVTGTGTTNYIAKWTSGSAIGNSIMQESTNTIQVNGNILSVGNSFDPNSNWQNAAFRTAVSSSPYGGGFALIDGTAAYVMYLINNGADFRLGTATTSTSVVTRLQLSNTGTLTLSNYGSGSKTGTATYNLAVDSSGNIIEVVDGGGTVTGTGTTNYVSKWTSSTAIGNSLIYDNGSGVAINSASVGNTTFKVNATGLSQTVSAVDIITSGSGTFQRGIRMLNSGMTSGESLIYMVGQSEGIKNTGQLYFYYSGANSNSNRLSLGLYAVDDVFNIFGSSNVAIGTTTDAGYKLDVNGYSRVQVSGLSTIFTGNDIQFTRGGATYITATGSGSSLYIGTNNVTDRLFISSTGAATFSSSVTAASFSTGGNVTLTTTGAGYYVYGNLPAARYSYFGYSSGYNGILVGSTTAQSLFFNVDVSANPSGAFGGNGSEYVWRNVGSFITPNSSNNGYNTLLSWNSSGAVTVSSISTSRLDVNYSGAGYAINATSNWTPSSSNNPIITFGRTSNAVAGAIGYDDSQTALYIGTTTAHTFIIKSYNTIAATFLNTGVAIFSNTINQSSSAATLILNRTGGTTYGAGVQYQTSGSNNWIVGTGQATVGTDYSIYNYGVGAGAVNITYGTNNVQIGGTTDAGYKLDVNGTGRFTSSVTALQGIFGNSGSGSYTIRMVNNDQSNVRLNIVNSGSGGQEFSIIGGLAGASNAGFSIYDNTNASTRFYINSTGAATLSNLAGTGTRIVVADASGTLSASSALSGYVPYTGATANVNLGAYSLTANNFTGAYFDYKPGGTETFLVGKASYNVFDGTQLGIATFTSIPIQFATANVKRVTITETGNFGIGNMSPDAKLTIGEDSSTSNVGAIRLRGYDIYEGNIYKTATYGIYIDTDSNLRPIRIDGSAFITGITGNVLIGTTTDGGYKLQVNGTNGGISVSGSGYTVNPTPMLIGMYTSSIGYIQVPSSGRIDIWNGGTGAIATFYNNSNVQFNGSVGIGTASPSAKLEVLAGNSTTSVLWGQYIRNEGNAATTGYGVGLKLKISGETIPNEYYKWAGIAAVAGTNYSNRTDLAIYTAANSSSDPTEKVRITGDAYVGINTNAPSTFLDILGGGGDATTYGILMIRNSSSRGISFGAYSSSYTWIQGNIYGTGTTALALQPNGANVLIGTTTDYGYKLNVSGTTQLRDNVQINNGTGGTSPKIAFGTEDPSVQGFKGIYLDSYWMYMQVHYNEGLRIRAVNGVGGSQTIATFAGSAGTLVTLGSITAPAFYESSDSRLKQIIQDDYKAVGIESVKARLYYKDGRRELGYYAQDLENILPSAVNINDEGFLNLSYTQVHTAKIAIIEDEVDVLKRKVSELESKLQKYEA